MTTTSIGDPLVGALLDGRYEVVRRLARGGMATVYCATDTRLNRAVAVKVMHEGLGDDADFARKFDREARSAAKLCHPNVVAVFDQGHDAGRPYIVMEYVPGCTLRNVISADAPMEPIRALELIDFILNALCAAHDNGLVHRDIKPENVLISERGHLKVADFGLARAVTNQTATATQGVLIGTVSYLPPELVLHGKADTRSDIYSTGVVLFELLTGTKPYTGETPIQVAYAHVHNQIPAPSTRLTTSWQTSRVGIPPYLDAVVLAATQREPDLRPRNARELQQMVRRALAALSAGVMDDPALTAEFTSMFAPVDDAHENSEPIVAEFDETEDPDEVCEEPESLDDLDEFEEPEDSHPQAAAPRPLAGTRRTPVSPDSPPTRRQPVQPRPAQRHRLPSEVVVRRRRFAALVLLVVLTITGTTGWWLLEGRFTATPEIVGMQQAVAEATAGEQGLQLRVDQAYSETVAAGQVISTDPMAGADVRRGGTVTAIVSRGPERYSMPRVVGMKRDDATAELERNNLAVGTINEAWHEELTPGLVTATSAEPGEQLRRAQRIDLTLSKGPKPIQVPDQTGRTAAEAQAALEKLGLRVVVQTANSRTVSDGFVISQDPATGVRKRGDTVTLVRSVGPVMVAVPEVKTKPVAEATKILTDAGFTVTTQPSETYLGLGIAARTDPEAGHKLPEGSAVVLFLV